MMDDIEKIIREDMLSMGKKCPNCHCQMKIKPNCIDSWYCPNPKCRRTGVKNG